MRRCSWESSCRSCTWLLLQSEFGIKNGTRPAGYPVEWPRFQSLFQVLVNVLVITLMFRQKRRNVTTILLMHLAFADLGK